MWAAAAQEARTDSTDATRRSTLTTANPDEATMAGQEPAGRPLRELMRNRHPCMSSASLTATRSSASG